MTWFRVDDGFPQHPKVLAIPRKDRATAVGLWTLAGGWCSAQLTDGHLASHMIDELGASRRIASLLVQVGLWEAVEGGYRFHDWADWNPTRAQVIADREATRDRVRKFRDRKRNAVTPPEVTAGVTRYNGVSNGPPVPTRPDPTPKESPSDSLPLDLPAEGRPRPAPDRFDEFWKAYPKKSGKEDARRAWVKAIRRADPELIIAAVKSYPFTPDKQFVKLPATWLRAGCWEDDPAALVPSPSSNGHRPFVNPAPGSYAAQHDRPF